jgi:hypothetical protein
MLEPLSLPSLARSMRSVSPPSVLRALQSGSRPPALRALDSRSGPALLREAARLGRQPSRLALGVIAGTVAVSAAVLAIVSAGASSPGPAAASQDAIGHAGPARVTGHPAPAAPPAAAGHAGPAAGHAGPAAGHAPPPAGHAPPPAARHAAPAGHPAGRAGHRAATSHAGSRPLTATAPARPYSIYDSVTPSAVPAGKPIATYADGPSPTPAQAVAGRSSVLWISITGSDYAASAVDVEPGNATPAQGAAWAWRKLHSSPTAVARIYTMISEWPAVQQAVASFPATMRERIHWWIADPTGTPHMVTGADATQWYWGPNYDITLARPGF